MVDGSDLWWLLSTTLSWHTFTNKQLGQVGVATRPPSYSDRSDTTGFAIAARIDW